MILWLEANASVVSSSLVRSLTVEFILLRTKTDLIAAMVSFNIWEHKKLHIRESNTWNSWRLMDVFLFVLLNLTQ